MPPPFGSFSVTAAATAADAAGLQATRFWTTAAAAADAASVPEAASAFWLVHSVLSMLLVFLSDEL